MKKMFFCLFSAVLLAVTVFADILIELDDSFWRNHQDDCVSRYREYTVNSPEGYAALWESPVSSRQTEVLSNGTKLSGLWHYTDQKGEKWFAVQSGKRNDNLEEIIRGWCKASDCYVEPDEVSFEEAYSSEFAGWDSAYDHVFTGADKLILWKYPCSGEVEGELEEVPDWLRNSPGQELNTCWRDPQGRMWTYLNYIFGYRNVWICLDNLSNADIGKDESILSLPESIYPAAGDPPKPSTGTGGLTIAAVVSVAAITIILLVMLFRKPASKRAEQK